MALHASIGAQAANPVALLVLANTAANRRFTFGCAVQARPASVRGPDRLRHRPGHHFSGSLVGLHTFVPQPHKLVELTVLVLANLVPPPSAFIPPRGWVFHPRRAAQTALLSRGFLDMTVTDTRRPPGCCYEPTQARWERLGLLARQPHQVLYLWARLERVGHQLRTPLPAGRHQSWKALFFVLRRRQRHHRRQAARGDVGDGPVGPAVRLQRIHHAAAPSPDGVAAVVAVRWRGAVVQAGRAGLVAGAAWR